MADNDSMPIRHYDNPQQEQAAKQRAKQVLNDAAGFWPVVERRFQRSGEHLDACERFLMACRRATDAGGASIVRARAVWMLACYMDKPGRMPSYFGSLLTMEPADMYARAFVQVYHFQDDRLEEILTPSFRNRLLQVPMP